MTHEDLLSAFYLAMFLAPIVVALWLAFGK